MGNWVKLNAWDGSTAFRDVWFNLDHVAAMHVQTITEGAAQGTFTFFIFEDVNYPGNAFVTETPEEILNKDRI